MFLNRITTCIAILMALCVTARADDAFYEIPLGELSLTEGSIPERDTDRFGWNWRIAGYLTPRVVLDGPGEAYVQPMDEGSFRRASQVRWRLCVRAPEGAAVAGALFVANADMSGMVRTRFEIDSGEASETAGDAFHRAKHEHFDQLRRRNIPGAAWFRFRASEARRPDADDDSTAPARRWRSEDDLNDAYALFTGGRAMAENLQLDRLLPQVAPGERTIPIDSIEGVTVRDYDWSGMLDDPAPETDPLASFIPSDQHAVFFPSFGAFMTTLDEFDRGELPIYQVATPRPEDARSMERYERQLGLRRNALARMLGPRLVRSVALTGSDPYFPSGTDVAVLFDPVGGDALSQALLSQVQSAAAAAPDAESVDGEVAGVSYRGFRNPGRTICSYVAAIDGAVVVTNSLVQLERLAAVRGGDAEALASLDEYRFFRSRYARDADEETAFLMLSDATIRRWSGPRWRIGTARRMLASAVLADAAARTIDSPGDDVVFLPESEHIRLADVQRTPSGIVSSRYGSLEFLTPVSELRIDKVTESEAQAYRQWRNGYQRNWTGAFDPIALRFTVEDDRLASDLTVMPLIGGTSYDPLISISQGASIGAADPHDTLLHAAMSVNQESPRLQEYGVMARSMMGVEVNPLSWVGETVALYADPDPFWARLADAEPGEAERVMEEADFAIPVGLFVEVSSMVKLTAFLNATRSFMEQTTPGMLVWESRKHGERSYVRVGLTEAAKSGDGWDDLTIYYAATPRALIVSPNETVLTRALDRLDADDAEREPAKWLGENVALNIDQRGWDLLLNGFSAEFEARMQTRAWDNIPILNEWRRVAPERDPVQFHIERFRTRLVDPGGGRYVWNEAYRTMESTVYGHPGDPRPGPSLTERVRSLLEGRLGVTFEHDGLRARVDLAREKADPR